MHIIAIFGTGDSSDKVLSSLKKENVSVAFFIDSNSDKAGTFYKNTDITIYQPEAIQKRYVDYIIIASIYPSEIRETLLLLGVEEEKIIPYFELDKESIIKYQSIFKTEYIIFDIMEKQLIYNITNIEANIKNLPYELYDKFQKKEIQLPKLLTMKETMEKIIRDNCSISRIGDGEYMLMLGRSINFQHYDEHLAERLEEVLKSNNSICLVAISDEFGSLDFFSQKKSKDEIRKFINMNNTRQLLYKKLNLKNVYGNAFITRPYMFLETQAEASYYFNSFKNLWNGKNVLIVEGEHTCFGVRNDLLDKVEICTRIIVPSFNAFSKYNDILQAIYDWIAYNDKKKSIILAAVGPTATILAYDISKSGFQILDIGHLDLEYEWYIRHVQQAISIPYKYCDMIYEGRHPSHIEDEIYETQIIKKIL